MGKRYLIDTNVIIDFQAKKLPDNGQSFVSEVIDPWNISIPEKSNDEKK